ncbi:MAG: alkaline phosphatase family protein [Gammaproteobacteria bacterium]|nr:alkaline phosphatase family protein [Gammaproteobacteria bacterium]
MKLLVVGLDALDIEFFAKTKAPNLKHLRDTGQWGLLWSGEKCTGPSWTTIMNGWSACHHGITTLQGVSKKPGLTNKRGEPIVPSYTFMDRPKDYIWDEIVRYTKNTVGVMNIPGLAGGAKKIAPNCWMVCGWPPLHAIHVFPLSIKVPPDYYIDFHRYAAEHLDHLKPPGSSVGWETHVVTFDQWLGHAKVYEHNRLKFAQSLPGVDVLFIQFALLDRAGHLLCTTKNGKKGAVRPRFLKAIALADEILGACIKAFHPTYLGVVSDHGFYGRGHTHHGTWAIRGPNIKAGRFPVMDQTDWTPTIAKILGIDLGFDKPRPRHRDGWCRLNLMTDAELQHRALAGMGYVDDSGYIEPVEVDSEADEGVCG